MQDDITIFAFMTHAHSLGAAISGYKVHNGKAKELAWGDPQNPQNFHQMENLEVARKGDILGARCTFDGTRTNKTTYIGILLTQLSNLLIF